MPLIIKENKHYVTRFAVGIVLIVFFAFAPLIIGGIGAWISELSTGESCHEGNCVWMVLPWLLIFTLPLGGIGLIIFFIIVIVDSIQLSKKKDENH